MVTSPGAIARNVFGGLESGPMPSSETERSIVQSYAAGVRSMSGSGVAASVARTSKWCSPGSIWWYVCGLTHSVQPKPSNGSIWSGGSFGCGGSRSPGSSGSSGGSGSGSRRHSNVIAVTGVRLSVAVNSKVADVLPVGSVGLFVMTVCGGSVSVWPTRSGTSPAVQTTPMHCSKSGGGGCGGLPGSTSGAPLPAAMVAAAVDVRAARGLARSLRRLAGDDAVAGVVVRLVRPDRVAAVGDADAGLGVLVRRVALDQRSADGRCR